jgi:hypothetical protein
MIGKKLGERYALGRLSEDRAVAALEEMLPSQAKLLVEVRARDPRMIACLVVRADKLTLRLCRSLGFSMKPGGSGVFGLLGEDAARLFGDLPVHQRAWLEAPSEVRETKVLLIAAGPRSCVSRLRRRAARNLRGDLRSARVRAGTAEVLHVRSFARLS